MIKFSNISQASEVTGTRSKDASGDKSDEIFAAVDQKRINAINKANDSADGSRVYNTANRGEDHGA